MELLTLIPQAVGLFLATNIDDVIVLSEFFARGAGAPGSTKKIVAGQYMGFGGIVLASVLASFGATTFLPEAAIAFLGLLPLLLGLAVAWKSWRGHDHGDDDARLARRSSGVLIGLGVVILVQGGAFGL